MNAAAWVSLIALSGWLVLALSAFRAHRVSGKKMLAMALTWGAIFLLVAAILSAVSAADQAAS